MAPPFSRPDFAGSGYHRPDLGPPPGFSLSDALHDPQYKLFLDHLRVVGQCYIFELPAAAGEAPTTVVYEGIENSYTGARARAPAPARKVRCGVKAAPLKRSHREFGSVGHSRFVYKMLDKDYMMFLNCVKLREDSMVFEGFGKREVVYEEIKEEGDDIREISKEDMNAGVEEVDDFVVHGDGKRVGDQVVVIGDEDGGKDGNGAGEVAEEVAGGPDGCLTLAVIDNTVFDTPRSLDIAPSQGVCYDLNEFLRGRAPSLFKSRLISVLKKPFSEEEYNALMRMVNVRTPIMKYKHLRDDSVAYPTDMPGYSYFDHYPDLSRMIEMADPFSGLSLLRGFFFWLKNVGHEGSFMPWINVVANNSVSSDDCMAIFPVATENDRT